MERESDADDEERQQGPHVGRAQPAAHPPDEDEENGREDARGRLGEQGEGEGCQRRGVEQGRPFERRGGFRTPPPLLRHLPGLSRGESVSPREPGVRREEDQNEGESVLALRHPGHGLHADGVQRESRRGEPGGGEGEAPKKSPEKERGGAVEQDVDEVIPERVKAPEPLLDPVGREDERVVLLVGRRVGPDPRQPRQAVQRRVLGDVGGVVPDEPGTENRQVRGDERDENRCGQDRADLLLHVADSRPCAGNPLTGSGARAAVSTA